jgi:alpha-N-acetylglucosaminidase
MLHNFGGNRDLYGNLPGMASKPVKARHTPGSTMVGTGLTMEAIEQNPVVYELMTDMGWFETSPPVHLWLDDYATQRYGVGHNSRLSQAWRLLLDGVYQSDYMTDSAITHVTILGALHFQS